MYEPSTVVTMGLKVSFALVTMGLKESTGLPDIWAMNDSKTGSASRGMAGTDGPAEVW